MKNVYKKPQEASSDMIEKMVFGPYPAVIREPSSVDQKRRPSQGHPLILILHGRGESGGDLNLQTLRNGPWPEHPANQHLPSSLADSTIIAPHLENEAEHWDPQSLLDGLVKFIGAQQTKGVVHDQIYLMGLSRGGRGVLRLAALLANNAEIQVAGVVAICPEVVTPEDQTTRLADHCRYLFVYRQHDICRATRSHWKGHMKHHGLVHKVCFAGISHDCWTAVFASPSTYEYLGLVPKSLASVASMSLPNAACDAPGCPETSVRQVDLGLTPELEASRYFSSAPFCQNHAHQFELSIAPPWVAEYRELLARWQPVSTGS